MYSYVSRTDIIDALIHIRALHRGLRPANESAQRAHERREASVKDLISNLPRTDEHPTLHTLLQVAEDCSLTLDGAHRLFGYSPDLIRGVDLQLNGGRTHIIESYPFSRDQLIDLPFRLAPDEAFRTDALLSNLVSEWQTELPIRVLEGETWRHKGTFYVYVGTEDSLGSSIPPGAIAQVELISREEELRPNPRRIYLLQFGNGYRCSRCVVTPGKLRPLSATKTYLGREEYIYPGDVRIAGRVRLFAMSLPALENRPLNSLPRSSQPAGLILPWEQGSRDRLFRTKHKRFHRSATEELAIQDFLKTVLHSRLSARSERRYRSPTLSEPHVNALIHLSLAHVASYSDSLRAGGLSFSDQNRFSLEALLNAKSFEELPKSEPVAKSPIPRDVWEARRKEIAEWPGLLSMKFPRLSHLSEQILRLAKDSNIHGLDPAITAGTWMLLEKSPAIPDALGERRKIGWSRPIYVLRRGIEVFCGYLDKDESRYALLSNPAGIDVKTTFDDNELSQLHRVGGVAVPV